MTAFTYFPCLYFGFCALWERDTRLQCHCRFMGQHFLVPADKYFFVPFSQGVTGACLTLQGSHTSPGQLHELVQELNLRSSSGAELNDPRGSLPALDIL